MSTAAMAALDAIVQVQGRDGARSIPIGELHRERRDGPAKVTGSAPHAAEHPFGDPAYAHPVQATVARATITAVDTSAAEGSTA